MIVRMRLRKWEDLSVTLNNSMSIPIVYKESCGFLEVFENLHQLQKVYPDETDYLQIEEKNNEVQKDVRGNSGKAVTNSQRISNSRRSIKTKKSN